nr:glyoxalase [uncultured Flavobacterium sp.]
MKHKAKSIRPFIGSKDFGISRRFYQDLGFKEIILAPNFSYFETEGIGFYLQDYYAKDWVDNTMIFLEVEDVNQFWTALLDLDLPSKYENVKLVPIRTMDWGKECFIHDPAGILWHVGEFNK